MRSGVTLAAAVVAASCGASTKRRADVHSTTSVERFLEILERGKSLYGLGAGCDEWRAEPEESAAAEGQLSAVTADAEGRLYGFSYAMTRDHGLVRLRIMGRGSWSPAPDVTISSPDQPGFSVIGSATMCVYDADVRADPDGDDAVLVGSEPWFLSRDACLRSRSVSSTVAGGCGAKATGAR